MLTCLGRLAHSTWVESEGAAHSEGDADDSEDCPLDELLFMEEDSVSEVPIKGGQPQAVCTWLYIQMELCNTSLRQLLDVRDSRARLDMDVIHNLMKDVGEGVRFVHAEGFIHRDIKPGAFLVS